MLSQTNLPCLQCLKIVLIYLHAEGDYEIFIQAMKGYIIIGPMRGKPPSLC
jgi:hypothetical protein